MNLFKTNLVQAQEDMQEMNEMIAIIERYQNKIVKSMAVPSWLLSDNSLTNVWSHCTETEWYSTRYPHKQPNISAIKIDVTKLP